LKQDAEEDVEVLSVRENVSREQQSASRKKGSGRTLLAAPAGAPAEVDSSRDVSSDLAADQQGTGQRPAVSSERLFSTAAVPQGDSILNHLGFGLQQQPLQIQSQDQARTTSWFYFLSGAQLMLFPMGCMPVHQCHVDRC